MNLLPRFFILLYILFSAALLMAQDSESTESKFEMDGYFFFRPDLDFNHGNPDFFIGNKAFNFFLRSDLGFAYQLSKKVKVKTTLQSFGYYTLDLGPLDPRVRLFEAFVEMKNIGNSNFHLKFGRFNLGEYGSGMVIGDRDWYNGRSFEAVKLTYEKEKLKSDLVWVQLYQNSNQIGGWNHPVLFIQHNHLKLKGKSSLDAYIYFLVDKHVDPYRSYTLMPGLRYANKNHKLQYFLEANPQIGWLDPGINNDTIGGGSVFAYAVETGLHYLIKESNSTKLGVEYYLASGDEDMTDNRFKNYNQFWQEEHPRFGNIDLFLGSNLQALTFLFSSKLNQNFEYGVNLVSAMVLESSDPSPGLLSTGMISQVNSDAGKWIGSGADLFCSYQYSEELKFDFNYSVFSPQSYILDNGGSDKLIMRIYAMCMLRF